PFPHKRSSERRTATATLVPKREDLDAFRVRNRPVVDVVANAREVKTTNAPEGSVPGASADLGLNGDEQRGAFEFLANGVGRFRSVDAPPVLGGVNLCPSEVADLDLKRSFHSRLRSSETRWAIGVVSPFSHCAIAWRSIRSVSASASNVSSPSSAKTVTDVP